MGGFLRSCSENPLSIVCDTADTGTDGLFFSTLREPPACMGRGAWHGLRNVGVRCAHPNLHFNLHDQGLRAEARRHRWGHGPEGARDSSPGRGPGRGTPPLPSAERAEYLPRGLAPGRPRPGVMNRSNSGFRSGAGGGLSGQLSESAQDDVGVPVPERAHVHEEPIRFDAADNGRIVGSQPLFQPPGAPPG